MPRTQSIVSPLTNNVQCDGILALKDITYDTWSYAERIAWLQMVNETNFETHKKDIEIIVPGYFFGTYSDFDQFRRHLVSNSQYNKDVLYSRQLIMMKSPPGQIEAWRDCVLAQTNQPKILCYVDKITPDGATLNVSWKTAPGLEVLRDIHIYPGDNGIAHIGNAFDDGLDGNAHITLQRKNPTKEVRGFISGKAGLHGDFSADFLWPVTPPPPDVSPISETPVSVGDHKSDIEFSLPVSDKARILEVTLNAASSFESPGSHVQRLWFWGPGVELDTKETFVHEHLERTYTSLSSRFFVLPQQQVTLRGHLYNNGAWSRGLWFSGRLIT